MCKGRCALPGSLAACKRARPLGSASDHPLTPSSKGRGVGLCAGPLLPEAVCPACEPVPLTAVLLVSQAPPATAGADQAEVVTGRWYQCSSMPFSRGLCGKLRNTERTNKVNETQVAHRKRGMWCVITETTGIFPLSPGQKYCGRVWVRLDVQERPSHPDPCVCRREGRQGAGR